MQNGKTQAIEADATTSAAVNMFAKKMIWLRCCQDDSVQILLMRILIAQSSAKTMMNPDGKHLVLTRCCQDDAIHILPMQILIAHSSVKTM
jgi:hypothetical protein